MDEVEPRGIVLLPVAERLPGQAILNAAKHLPMRAFTEFILSAAAGFRVTTLVGQCCGVWLHHGLT